MLANRLKTLYENTPGIILSGPALEDLIDDTQAAFIRTLRDEPGLLALQDNASVPEPDGEDSALDGTVVAMIRDTFKEGRDVEIENETEDIWVSQFGVQLFNLFSTSPVGRYYFSARKRIVYAMLRALVVASQNEEKRDAQAPLS